MSESVINLQADCFFAPLTKETIVSASSFSCGNADLDDFFQQDAVLYAEQLMGKSYRFISSDASQKKIVCAFTVSNDSLKVYDMSNSARNKLQRGIASVKRMRSYPAVLIGRLGVSVEFQGKGLHLGNQLMDFIKLWFLHPNNKTGCRFIVVDAYNTPKTIAYYQCNGFSFLYQNEDDEKRMFKISLESSLKTRLMIYDLMNLVKLLGTQN